MCWLSVQPRTWQQWILLVTVLQYCVAVMFVMMMMMMIEEMALYCHWRPPVLPVFLGFNHEVSSGERSCTCLPNFSEITQSVAEWSPFNHFQYVNTVKLLTVHCLFVIKQSIICHIKLCRLKFVCKLFLRASCFSRWLIVCRTTNMLDVSWLVLRRMIS